MDLSLFFAGTGGSVPSPPRAALDPSASRGRPAAVRLRRRHPAPIHALGGLADVDCVFITHFHADHWLGLPGMLSRLLCANASSRWPYTGLRPEPADGRKRASSTGGSLRSAIYRARPADDDVAFDGYAVAPITVSHRANNAYGYAIVEDSRPGHLDPKLAEQLGVTPGPDFGKLTRGETVAGVSPEQVMGPTREGRKIVISGDTSPCEMLTLAAHEADLLVHEATFAEEEFERAHQTGHSTARQAARVARDAEVRLLALTHISSSLPGRRSPRRGPLGVCRDRGATRLRHDRGALPREGPAELMRWSERRAREQTTGAPVTETPTEPVATP